MSAAEIADAAAAARDLDLVIELGTKGIEPGHLETLPAARRRLRRPARAQHAVRARSRVRRWTRPSGCCARRCPRTRRPGSRSPSRRTSRSPPTTSSASSSGSAPTTSASASTPPTSSPGSRPRARPSSAAPRHRRTSTSRTSRSPARTAGWASPTAAPRWAPACTTTRTCSTTVRPDERGINQIVEHWLPWQGDPETTVTTEREWTRITLEYLRSMT